MVLSNKAKARRRQTRRERAIHGIFKCKICGGKLDKHHTMCNSCWAEQHPWEAKINRKKTGKY